MAELINSDRAGIYACADPGKIAKNFKKEKHVIRRWRLERFDEDEVKLRYQNALKAEVHGFWRALRVN